MSDTGNRAERDGVAQRWKELARRVSAGISEHRIFSLAAASTYYGLLALFPAMAALVAIYAVFFDPDVIGAQIASLQGLLPQGALEVVSNELRRIASQNHGAQGFAMVAGLLIAIWSANSAIKALFDSLNQVYGEKEERGFFAITVLTSARSVFSFSQLISPHRVAHIEC